MNAASAAGPTIRIMLHGRPAETARIDALLDGARHGRSAALVFRGEAGIGKSALLDYAAAAAAAAADLRVLRCAGVQSEAELAFAALHQVLRPALRYLDDLPGPQAAALRGVFGLAAPQAEDRFLIALAALSALSDLAGEGPVLCLVDDAQWLDHASAAALLFVARRLDAEGVVLLFAARDDNFDAAGLPELKLGRLGRDAASSLLAERSPDLAGPTRDRVLAEASGNPLALLELPALEAEPLPGSMLPERLQEGYFQQISRLPGPVRTLLLVAAAEETGDLPTVLHAAGLLGVSGDAMGVAERSGLVTVGPMTVSFRHPLVRAAAYHGAVFADRCAAHRALAETLASPQDDDRRAWHRAIAATGPDEQIAAELERTAARASGRHGYSAAAAALERAAALTPDRAMRARRLIAAAEAAATAGQSATALSMSELAAPLTIDPRELARIARVRGQVASERGQTREAFEIITAAAESISGIDPPAAARMLAETLIAGRHDTVLARAAFAQLQAITQAGSRAAAPAGEISDVEVQIRTLEWVLSGPGVAGESPQHLLHAAGLAHLTGDYQSARSLGLAAAQACRASGRISLLPFIHSVLAATEVHLNRFSDAAATAAEGLALATETGQPLQAATLHGVLAWLAAVAGDEQRCRDQARQAAQAFAATDNPTGGTWAEWALALLDLGAGRHQEALDRLEGHVATPGHRAIAIVYFAADQVEAAARLGGHGRCAEPLTRLENWIAVSSRQPGTEALLRRCLALTGPAEQAEEHYLAAVSLHAAGGRLFDQARTQLLYGEWLRRDRRSADARAVLRAALERFEQAGAVPWADRARAELRAAGEKAQVPAAARATDASPLTPQELQVVRLAATGATNRDIAARLFLSPRTVSHHLYRAFPKLGVASRTELARLDLTGWT
jgi:DNA-binding CsgD family transcriptional regulator